MNESIKPVKVERMLNRIERAIVLATSAHAGQHDRSGQPYILHPLRVGAMGTTEETQVVGFLHDVLEDTSTTEEKILDLFGQDILTSLLSVTKLPKAAGEDYMAFVARAAKDPVGKYVKLNDLYDNTRHDRMCLLHKVQRRRLIPKYEAAIKYLEACL